MVRAAPLRIPREQRHALDGGVGTDVEIRLRRGARARGEAVVQEGLAGQEAGFPPQLQPGKGIEWQRVVQRLDAIEADRHLCVDDGVDAQLGLGSAGVEPFCRPCRTTADRRSARPVGRWRPPHASADGRLHGARLMRRGSAA